jgi:hypothetical protein
MAGTSPAMTGVSTMTNPCYYILMTIEDLEKAVSNLPPDQLAKFRAWFDAFDAARLDEKIERDAKAGKLDRLAHYGDSALNTSRNRTHAASAGRTRFAISPPFSRSNTALQCTHE